jgi:DNA (cytosine-5)-methyltransferase 1
MLVRMLNAISLYTGIGGLDFGFEAAGFRTSLGIELDACACAVLRANRRWQILEGDIADFSSRTILNRAGLCAEEADVLIGGPPCQPFSKASNWKLGNARHMLDPRSTTLKEYLRVLSDTRPRAFLLENVPGLAALEKNAGLQYLLKGIDSINRRRRTRYTVAIHRVNAAAFGVPQMRERIFLVGFRDGTPFSPPRKSHSDRLIDNPGLAPYVTAWDAIGDLNNSSEEDLWASGKWGDLLPSIPEGRNYLWHTRRGGGKSIFGWRTRYWSFLLKLAKNRPAWTISANPGPAIGPFHWRNRRLSVREMCRIQTLPEDLRIDCARVDAQRLIGNAVPSLLAEVFATAIRNQLLGTSRACQKYKLAIPRRGPSPRAERARQVPSKYMRLVGRHADHPGTGMGRGARLWRDGAPTISEK